MSFVELGLRKPDFSRSSEAAAGYARLSDGLLETISGSVPDAESFGPGELRREIARFRQALREAADRRTFDADVHACLELCRRTLERVRRHAGDRERGFVEIIEVLTAAVDDIAGQSSAFNARMLGESDRLGRLVRLDDVTELKRQVTERVGALRRAIAERQVEEESARTRLESRVKSLRGRLSEAETAASVDGLTGVANRRQFERTTDRFIAGSLETGRQFALALVDVDDFKRVNDQHGHQVGDRVLVALAQTLLNGVRKSDVVARYGGEEFGLLLADTSLANATRRIAALVQEVGATDYTYENDGRTGRIRFSVSAGVAEYSIRESQGALIKRADEALYAAKRAGKNRVVASRHAETPSEAVRTA